MVSLLCPCAALDAGNNNCNHKLIIPTARTGRLNSGTAYCAATHDTCNHQQLSYPAPLHVDSREHSCTTSQLPPDPSSHGSAVRHRPSLMMPAAAGATSTMGTWNKPNLLEWARP